MATIVPSAAEAVADVCDGSTVLICGFGAAGQPVELIEALLDSGARDLIVVSNNAGNGDYGLAALIREGRVATIGACATPRPGPNEPVVAEREDPDQRRQHRPAQLIVTNQASGEIAAQTASPA